MNAFQVPQTSGNNSVNQGVPQQPLVMRITDPFFARRFGHFAQPTQEGTAAVEQYEGDMAEFQAESEETIRRIKLRFILDGDGSSVVTFLSEHRTIPQILLESVEPLKQAFGTGINFTLRAPVEDDARHMLYVTAPWAGSVSDARAALSQFDESWWLAHAYQASGHLTFNYELI